MSSELKTNKISPATGTALQIGDSGDTVDIPSGATFDVTGATVTGLSAGKVLQVVQGTHAVAVSTTGTTYVTTGLSASITPSSSSNKVLVFGYINSFYAYGGPPAGGYISLYRGGSAIVTHSGWFYTVSSGAASVGMPFNHLDSPSSTSSLTYEVYFKRSHGTTVVVQDQGPSSITLMEIEA